MKMIGNLLLKDRALKLNYLINKMICEYHNKPLPSLQDCKISFVAVEQVLLSDLSLSGVEKNRAQEFETLENHERNLGE